jgi:hypothetical protein
VQRPLTSGPRGWSASLPGFMSVWPVASCTRVYTRRGRPRRWRKSVEAEPHGQSAIHHLVSCQLNQIGNPSLDPYKYPSTGGNQNTHHILEIPLAKLLFLVCS